MIVTYYILISGRSLTGTFKHTHTHTQQSKKQLEQIKQSKNKQAGEQAKDLIFHRWRVNKLLQKFTTVGLTHNNTIVLNILVVVTVYKKRLIISIETSIFSFLNKWSDNGFNSSSIEFHSFAP